MHPTLRSYLIASCVLALLAGCGGGDNNSTAKTDSFSEKEEVALKMAHGSESTGDIGAAENQYMQIAKQNPVEGSLELAEFYVRQHHEDKATEILSEAAHENPKNSTLPRALGNLYIHRHMSGKALDTLNAAIKKFPNEALLYNSKGVALDMLKSYKEAQESYQKALLLAPDDAMTFKANLAMSYILEGHPKKAVTLLQPELNNPDVTPTIRQNLALAYGLMGQKTKAQDLGQKDLSNEEMEQNLNFYRIMHHEPIAKDNDASSAAPAAPPVIP